LTPCYYTDPELTTIYKTNQLTPHVDWNANGYRLPTEAEWEKAARGGAGEHRFPWIDTDNITQSSANFYSYSGEAYDTCPTNGFHPVFATGDHPYTNPVGYFASNGYGLYDMAGNVWEACWDWYGAYSGDAQTDPYGPASGSDHVLRGGSWNNTAESVRCANRHITRPDDAGFYGFRCVRGL
jgi:formylglycine-generating enzyme required for sulfatase activity